MLEWIWFAILTLTGLAGATVGARRRNRFVTFSLGYWVAALASGAALNVSWAVLGAPIADALHQAVPQGGTNIHDQTVWVLVGLAGTAFVSMVCVLPHLILIALHHLAPRPAQSRRVGPGLVLGIVSMVGLLGLAASLRGL